MIEIKDKDYAISQACETIKLLELEIIELKRQVDHLVKQNDRMRGLEFIEYKAMQRMYTEFLKKQIDELYGDSPC
jgi:FtsZ-binding cell division protein ZapB